jgi:hypothetical protein
MKAAAVCLSVVAGFAAAGALAAHPREALAEAASRASCTAPPAPGGKTRTVPEGHAKASSFAPGSRSHKRVYGAPIPKPIVSRHTKPRHRKVSPPPAASSK